MEINAFDSFYYYNCFNLVRIFFANYYLSSYFLPKNPFLLFKCYIGIILFTLIISYFYINYISHILYTASPPIHHYLLASLNPIILCYEMHTTCLIGSPYVIKCKFRVVLLSIIYCLSYKPIIYCWIHILYHYCSFYITFYIIYYLDCINFLYILY